MSSADVLLTIFDFVKARTHFAHAKHNVKPKPCLFRYDFISFVNFVLELKER